LLLRLLLLSWWLLLLGWPESMLLWMACQCRHHVRTLPITSTIIFHVLSYMGAPDTSVRMCKAHFWHMGWHAQRSPRYCLLPNLLRASITCAHGATVTQAGYSIFQE